SGQYEWVDKRDPRVSEPRILVEKESYGEKNSDNLLIRGDNLLALKALEQDYSGKVKCIYIDPPYNTGSAFTHYDDGLEHSIWLSLMKVRLEILRKLLRDDGFIFVQIDDNEMAYLKVLLDEVFGRANFINTLVWKRRGGATNPSNRLNNVTDFILWYSNSSNYTINHIFSMEDDNTQKYIEERFINVDEKGRKYMKSPLQSPNPRPNLMYDYKGYRTPKNGWSISRELMEHWDKDGKLVFPEDKNQNINRKVYLDEYKGQPVPNLWTDIKVINPMSKERLDFDGQKPESIIHRVFTLTTKEGDLVLDSFLGTGTTAAVAHKMKRKWIGVELGEQAETYVLPRLKKVVDGTDIGGVTSQVDWKGGGGFKYFVLGESLFVRDADLRLTVINPKMYNGSLIRAVLKVEKFRLLHPDNGLHGISGTTIAHVTEQYLNQSYVDTLLNEVGSQAKFLVIYAKTVSSKLKLPDNVEVKRIPDILLKKFTV
ncbi:MAG: site-specific DNA-methyltransferase, partial [Nitrosotalea sp.]